MTRGTVKTVGYCHPDGYLTGFVIDGGDYVYPSAVVYKRGKLHSICGWPLVQLVLMARTGKALEP